MTNVVPGIRPGILRPLTPFGLLLFGLAAPGGVWAQTPDSLAPPPLDSLVPPPLDSPVPPSIETKANPFSGFETHYLANGLKVWFKRLPEAPNVSISVGVPYGWDSDPRGKEELAHLTEHVLFSDHDGRTEQEIVDAIEGIGGRRNGFTTPDHTWYYVTVSKEHGAFALEWLSRVLSPHSMDADVVERNRQPVALEINAQPREFFESVWALLNPSWLLPRDFWRREFGMQTRNGRRYDRWASLQRITPEDVAGFYERYYVPEAMTLTVIGDLDLSEVLEVSERTFGSLDPRPIPPRDMAIEDPGRERATYSWSFGPNVRYTARHKLFNSSAEDDLMVLFVRDLLRRRLNQRLRYGEQKAVYGIEVSTAQRGPGGFLQIRGSIAEDDFESAQAIIQEEIKALREGTLLPGEFEADRTALVERLRGENSTSQALNFWVLRNFYDPSKHTDFPDLISFFADVTQEEVAAFATRTLVPERAVTTLVRVQLMSRGMLAAAVLVLVLLTVRAVAWTLTRPLTMPKILYVARFRVPILLLIAAAAVFGAIGLIVGRVIVFLVQSLALAFLVTSNVYSVQLVFYGAIIVTAVVLSILGLSLFPRKLLVFPDHLRIKFLAYRSRVIKPDDIQELSTRRIHQVWFRKDLFRCVPLAWGAVGPGIYLRPAKGRAFFFRTRDTGELIDVLGGWRGSSVLPAIIQRPKKKKKEKVERDPFEEAQDTSNWIASIAPDVIAEDETPSASVAPDPIPEIEEAPDTIASLAPDPPPEIEAPPDTIASLAPDPIPEIEDPPDTIASMAPDPDPKIEDPPDTIASLAPDPPPEIEDPPDTIASMAPDPIPEIEEPTNSIAPSAPDPLPESDDPAAWIAKLAPDPLPEHEVEEIPFDNTGMREDEIKKLLGESYDPDADDKF